MWACQGRAGRRKGPPCRRGQREVLAQLHKVPGCENLTWNDVQIASTIFAVKPGDGSA